MWYLRILPEGLIDCAFIS